MLVIKANCDCNVSWTDASTSTDILSSIFDDQNHTTVEFSCPNCKTIVPVSISRNHDGTDYIASLPGGYGDVALAKYVDIEDPDDFDIGSYMSEVVAQQPNAVFQFAFDDVDWVLMNVNNHARENPTFIRMIFTQLFAIFETYLADRLVRLVEENDTALRALVASHPSWENETLSFRDAFNAVNVVRERVTRTLVKILYHDFPKVDPIYRAVFGSSIFCDQQDKALLNRYRLIRHDCVHRNGKTIDGTEHKLNHDNILELAAAIKNSYESIEAAYTDKYVKRGYTAVSL